uniref:Small subunit processome component 20 homolog n=1 Tax=Diabrotica virgifera virgifera TaxID=50390 RepID=A0A6P7FQB3_DIAVI
MKNKSVRHKDANTFKFLPFSERISNIDIDIFHKVPHEYDSQDEENETFFQQTITKWTVMNLSQGYEKFQRDIRFYDYITLPQLLLVKDHLIQTMLKYVKEGDPLYMQPLLELIVALARDLQKEFHQYFPEVLETLINLMNTKNTEQLEWIFTCLAYLFKFLWRPLVKDINSVFNSLLPLLSDSKPEYINNFAAESFAFVARKVKDKKTFLNLLLKTVKSQPDGVPGCGKLLFQVICGVDGQFHSCAESILPFLLDSLISEGPSQTILFEVLENFIANLVNNIKPQKGDLVWSTYITTLKSLIEKYSSNPNETVINNTNYVLKLIGHTVEYKSAKFVQKPAPLIDILLELLNTFNQSEETVLLICQISILLLTSNNLKLSQEQASILTRRLLSTSHKKVFLSFVDNIKTSSSFEALILPNFLRYCAKNALDAESFHLLVKIVMHKSSSSVNGINLLNHVKYNLDFKESNESIAEILINKIKESSKALLSGDVDDYYCSLVCLPHISPKINEDMFSLLEEMIKVLLKSHDDDLPKPDIKKSLFLINITLECLMHLGIDHKRLFKLFEAHLFEHLLNLAGKLEYISSLQSLDLVVTYLGREDPDCLSMSLLLKLNEGLKNNFNSPFHEVRLLTAHVYTAFEHLPDFKLKHSTDPEAHTEEWKVFSLMYNVESIEAHVHTYRDQLQSLERLTFDKPQMLMCKQTEFSTLPLRYLCGTLFINFQLLWEPVIKIITSYANGMEINTFWEIFGEELKLAPQLISSPPELAVDLLQSSCATLGDFYEEVQTFKSKPDFNNYRLLIWKALVSFANVAEAKTRDVSQLLLTFVSTEYMVASSDSVPSQSIKQNVQTDTLDESSADKDDTEDSEGPQTKKGSRKKGKILIKDGLIPIVMQIVFGKMNIKTGLRTGGKSSSQMRRSTVFRFLAGCQENELLGFLQKVLRVYSKFLVDDPFDMVNTIYKDCNLETFLPPKRLLSTINLLGVIHEQCGGLMGNEVLTYLLKVILVIGSHLKFAFDLISEVHAGYLAILRNLRVSCIKIIEKFFDHFDRYPWTTRQIDALFAVFVWPYLDKLNIEGIHSPTALLKLIAQWGSNPRYFCLLVKYRNVDPNQYVLPHVLKLLVNEKSHVSVVNMIEEMLEKLLSLQPDEDDIKNALQVNDVVTIEQDILDKVGIVDNLNYGSMILLPHVSIILSKIEKKLLTKSKNLNQKELFILSRISELVWDPLLSDKILDLLLPVVLKKCAKSIPEEVVLKYITTILNLMQNVEKPEIHLKQVSPLFFQVSYPSSRKLLVQIVDVMFKKSDGLKLIPELVGELNAFDKKWVDQPDFERRHNAFKKVQEYLSDGKIDTSLGIIIIYNCCYFISHENDLSARENSSHTLKKVSVHLTENYPKQSDLILNETLFNLIRTGFKSVKDEVRHEYISLLGHLARECPTAHFILRDLNKYANTADPEVDFFENLVHLQLHRHARALLKFCQITKDQTDSPNPRTLTQFILPLASHYLYKEKYVSKNSVVDAAIEAVGVVCRILPWHQYEGVLKYYLLKLSGKLEYQKQLVRLIVVILDAFHFDLRHAHYEKPPENEDKKKGSKKRKDNKNLIVNGTHINKHNDTINKSEHNLETSRTEDQMETDSIKESKDSNEEVVEVIRDNNQEEDEEKDVDEFLESEDEVEDEVEEDAVEEKLKIMEKITILCKSTATRIVRTFELVLIPKLHKSLAEMTHHESSHKVNRKKLGFEREEEDLLRVPISLALVKLLQKLPESILEQNLPGVFMKACTFLRSHLESVRKVAKETLQKIMITLGPKYLSLLIGEMSPLLGRGYQVHVLVFTIHGVLSCLKEYYKPSDIDQILLTVLDFCSTDIFGTLSEEKEVAKIAVKVAEARRSKSYDTLQILAQFITESCLLDLILPVKKVLEKSHSFKTAHKAQEALRYISLGLVDNTFVPTESLLKFAYGTSSKSIPQLLPKEPTKKTEKDVEKMRREREDCFIIPKVAGNRDLYRLQNVKTSIKTNAHILVEFGLRLCYVMLKREKVRDESYKMFIDPFINVFKNCLKSKHIKLSSLTLQSLVWVMKYDLPSLKLHIKPIVKEIFAILHKYASAGLSKGDNFDLVVAAFKAMAVLVREVKYHSIDTNQLKILLLYVEQDIHDYERQATAFNLLKAILSRKIDAPELSDVMQKVAELSIVSEMDHVRAQSRAVFHQYLMDYPLGNTLEKHLGFYISQLGYELRFGRESAIEMIMTLINSFPLEVLKTHSATLLVTLGARLINDEEPECRKRIAECISAMLKKLLKSDRDPLFEIVTTWLKDKNVNHRRLAAQICGIFVTIEKSSFETRLPSVTPLLLRQFGIDNAPGRLVRINKKEETFTEEQQRSKDHHLFQVLQLLLKLSANCPSLFKDTNLIENLAVHIQTLLAYPHDWVRLGSAQFLGYVLAHLDIDHIRELLIADTSDDTGYLCNDPTNAVKSLTLDLCDQLQPKNVKSDLAEQVVKNLVFIAKLLQNLPVSENKPNLLWLTKRMRKIINTEIVENAVSTTLRTEVFKWIAGVAAAVETENVLPILHHLVAPLVRELATTEEKNAPLRHLSKEVSNLIKAKVGVEKYTETITKQQQHLSIKRAERKRSRTQLAVTDPESFAKKKIKRHEKKKDAKKRKIESLKGTKRNFKRRKTTIDLDSSEII